MVSPLFQIIFMIKFLVMASTSKISPLAQTYLNHYIGAQSGSGAYPVFRGSPYQSGQGLGDILRSIGRFLLPIATTAASAFIDTASGALSEGKSLKEASTYALRPTLKRTLESVGERIQSGSGRRRKKERYQ